VLGTGWTHAFNITLRGNKNGSYTLREGDGRRIVLYQNGSSYTPQTSAYPILTKNTDGTSVLTYKEGVTCLFDAVGKIARMADRNGNAVQLVYNTEGRLTTIADQSGRAIALTYDAAGRITSIADPSGNRHTFTYTDDTLTRILTVLPDNSTMNWTYTYDGNAYLLSKTDPGGQTTVYTYDSNYKVVTSTDPEGKVRSIAYPGGTGTIRKTIVTEKDGGVWSYTYDADRKVLTEKSDPQGGKTTYTYDAYRNVLSTTEPGGGTTIYAYDTYGNMASVTNTAGQTTTYTYNTLYQVVTITTSDGRVTSYTYDDRGNVTSITDALGSITHYGYDGRGNLLSLTDAMGQTTQFMYDSAGNISSITDPAGARISLSYDAAGNMKSMTDIMGKTTRFEYDSLNRLLKIIDPLGNVSIYTYDKKGNRTSVTDANGNITRFAYNSRGQVIKVTDAIGGGTTYTYGSAGCSSCGGGVDKLTAITDANGNTTTFTYDSLGRLISETDPLGSTTTYAYDASGNLTGKTDADGNVIAYAYDVLKRLTQKTYPDGTTEVFQYDTMGNIIYAANKDIAYNIVYDAKGRIIQIIDSNGRAVTYQYDPLGNRTGMTTPEGKSITYSYDQNNRIMQILNDKGQSFTFSYDASGRRTAMNYPNGTTTSYTYDPVGRLMNLSLSAKNAQRQIVDAFTYTHDKIGNRITKAEDDIKYTYSYDAVYRLLQALPTKKSKVQKEQAEDYSYDPVGNRLKGPKQTDQQYTYNKDNQLTTDRNHQYQYDANGNLIRKVDWDEDGKKKTHSYFYDYENRLMRVEIQKGRKAKEVTFTYDPFGRRISKSVHRDEIGDDEDGDGEDRERPRTTQYVYDNEDILMEFNHKGRVTALYLHGPGIDEPLAVEKKGSTYYYHADGLGSIVALTDERGKDVQSYSYDSFGNMKYQGSRIKQPYTFTGREWDSETKLYYYRARYYDPIAGMFTQKDPIGFSGGDVNLYRMVGNNPVNWIDPLGLEFITPEEALRLMVEFKTWLGTPYLTGGKKKGKTGGADCSHSTNEGYNNAGFPYVYSRTKEFAQNPMFKPSPANTPQIGDVALWNGHMVVYAGDGEIYTAHRPGGAAYSADTLSDWTKNLGNPNWYRYYKPD
jgi:RHS repeat-associated protein